MRALGVVVLLFALSAPIAAQRYELAVDVPSELGGATRLPSEVLAYDFGSYSAPIALPAGVQLNAFTRDAEGLLFVPSAPVELDGTTFLPTQIVRRKLDGSFVLDRDVGLPGSTRIDALFLDELEQPVISFDVPTDLGGTTYGRSDLIALGAGAALYLDADAAGVPAYANLHAADLDENGELVVAFDVPTRLSGFDALPGQLVRWDGSLFATASFDTSWPAGSQIRALDIASLSTAAGKVPNTLTLHRIDESEVQLDWAASCAGSDDDYEVYVGELGSFTSHVADTCTTQGATTWSLAPEGAALYFLVVPTNGVTEGSYGLRSDGTERPVGPSTCRDRELGACG